MSLQLLAKQMEAKGRKGDSMLVHMTPEEVAGLQKLAESAGGTLSVNPDTGLVEANFLKRMLPTLVGIGVGAATMNPFAGAAAGAAVGGYQAKRNDQDVGMGILMGGLGGYGGAGLGAGLTAAGGTTAANVAADATAKAAAEEAAKKAALEEAAKQQAAEQSAKTLAQEQTKNQLIGAATPDMTMSGIAQPDMAAQYGLTNPTANMTPMPANVAPMPTGPTPAPIDPTLTASESVSRAGEGIGQLATKQGRTAFGKEFGMTEAGAGAAPLMAPGKMEKDEMPKEDDEMFSYTYNPGRTGAERSPRATTAERQYFNDGYSPLRKIRASQYGMAQGGLMSLAEGGSTGTVSGTSSEGMTGASKAAFDYLMGRSSDSDYAGQGETKGGGKASGKFSGKDQMYMFDPATGTFMLNPNYEDPEVVEARRLAAEAAAKAAAEARAEKQRSDSAAAARREEERKRALPNVTPPKQGSIVARPSAPESSGGGGGGYDPSPFEDDNYPIGIVTIGDLQVAPGGGDFSQTAEANAQAEATGGTGTGYGGDGSEFARGGLMGLAKGGIMRLAEGGDVSDEASTAGASDAALDYLMGERYSSSAGLPAIDRQAPVVGSDNMYAFNPETGEFLRNPNVGGATSDAVRGPVGTSFAGSGGSDNAPMSQQTKDFFDNESFLQREARMGEVNNLFSLGPTAAFINAITGIGPQGRAPDVGTLIGKSDLYNNLSDENMRSEGGRGGYDNSSDRGGYDPSSGDVGGEGGRGVDGTATGGMGASSARAQGGEIYTEGGLMGLAKGGMASGGFVVPADVVSALGNGSTDAGLRMLKSMMGNIKPIKGKGDGLSDSIKTNIDGKQPARVADGEAYIDPKTVKRLGGAKKLYALMDKVRAQAHGKTTQQRKVNPARVMA